MPSFRKVKCRFGQGKGGGNYTNVSYLEFPSLPFPDNILLQTLSPLPPQPLSLGVAGAPSGPAIPTWVHFLSTAWSWCLLELLVLLLLCPTMICVPSLSWVREPETVLPKKGRLSLCLSQEHAGTCPVGKVTLFFLSVMVPRKACITAIILYNVALENR